MCGWVGRTADGWLVAGKGVRETRHKLAAGGDKSAVYVHKATKPTHSTVVLFSILY